MNWYMSKVNLAFQFDNYHQYTLFVLLRREGKKDYFNIGLERDGHLLLMVYTDFLNY